MRGTNGCLKSWERGARKRGRLWSFLNSSKTEFMLIGSRQRLVTYDTCPKLIIGGDIIKQVSSVKSLGVHIDETLSWTMHIEKIAKKIASGIGAIKRCRPFVNQTTLESVFNALVQPYFNYCSEVWGIVTKVFRISSKSCKTGLPVF